MIVQDIYLEDYDWSVRVYYAVNLLLQESMWNAMALEEGKQSSSVLQVAVSGWEKQRNGYRMG